MSQRAFTLRLTPEMFARIREHGGSTTGFIVEAIEEKLARERREAIRRGFESLADKPDAESGQWIEAQREAMKRVDS